MNLQMIILRKMFRHRYIGGRHTAVKNLAKGMPKHLRGEAKTAAEELVKAGLVMAKQTSYGLQVSLNPERLNEITKIVEENS